MALIGRMVSEVSPALIDPHWIMGLAWRRPAKRLHDLRRTQYKVAMRSKLEIGALVALVIGFVVVLQMQQQKVKRLTAENAELRVQLEQIAVLQETNEDLANQLKAAIAASQTNQSELLRLRGQAVRLRQLEQENAQIRSDRQQLALQMQQSQAAAAAEQGRITAITETLKPAGAGPARETTDLGSLQLQHGVPVQFDLGGGTNCIVTPTALPDGNNTMQITLGVIQADGTFSEQAVSRIVARPGQQCSISLGDRMISLAATVRP